VASEEIIDISLMYDTKFLGFSLYKNIKKQMH